MNNEAVVDFLKEIEKFKTCERTCRTTDTTRAESDAEHSWHLATFLLLLEDELGFIGTDVSVTRGTCTGNYLASNKEMYPSHIKRNLDFYLY